MWKSPAAAKHAHDGEDDEEDDDAAEATGGGNGAAGNEEDEGEEDAFDDRADDFERKHNFRYEEAGANQIMTHPRHDPNSVRRQAQLGRKKEAEDAKKVRKAEAKAAKEAELKRLKNLKKRRFWTGCDRLSRCPAG